MRSFSELPVSKAVAAVCLVSFLFRGGSAAAAAPPPLQREVFVRAVLDRSPVPASARAQARVAQAEARRVASLPEPELMLEVSPLPLQRPAALGEAGMVEVGLRQVIPAPGSLGRREAALQHLASESVELGQASLREVAREAAHVFVDYATATELSLLHGKHHELVGRLQESFTRSFVPPASALDATRVGIESGRVEAEIATAQARVEAARARMNALLGRPAEHELGAPLQREPETVVTTSDEVVRLARARRPELRAGALRVQATQATVAAAQNESRVPSFAVAALYYPAVGRQREHGYGVAASMSLPWLWGARRAETQVSHAQHAAAAADVQSRALAVSTEALTALGETGARAARLRTLLVRVRPLLARQVEIAESRLATGSQTLPAVVEAWRARLEVDAEIAEARAELEHALIDLDWASGGAVPRVRLLTASAPQGGEKEVP